MAFFSHIQTLPRTQPLAFRSTLTRTPHQRLKLHTFHHRFKLQTHSASLLSQRRYLNGNAPGGPPTPNNFPQIPEEEDASPSQKSRETKKWWNQWNPTFFKMFESAATTLASVVILAAFGYGYTQYYKHNVLTKIRNAFAPGDPVLDLAGRSHAPGSEAHFILRNEQPAINAIIDGTDQGHYFLIIGEKGQGKSSMILEAMQRVDGTGISMMDAHADIEIFRIRLGKALDFEFHEDNIGSLFSIRGPRDASALLDIERAFNKFEKVALKNRNEGGKPFIIIINSMHLLRDNEEGRNLLELIQQRAEQWCASKLCTLVLNSDDYWVYERLKEHATRMEVLPVKDLTKDKAMDALRKFRYNYRDEEPPLTLLEQIYDRVGGRLSFLNRVSKADDMLAYAEEILQKEKTWLLNQCWILGEEMDDDVMDQQKYASSAMVLAKALYDKENETNASAANGGPDAANPTYDPATGYNLPTLPLFEARQVMTRADFIQHHDKINIFTIDSRALVRADSVPMQLAFREICGQPGFEEHLEKTLDRISAIESLGRTRELTIKDLWDKGRYRIRNVDGRGRPSGEITMEVDEKEKQDEDNGDAG